MPDLKSMSSKELVALYNKHASKKVKKFKDKATALKRVKSVLPKEKGTAAKGERKKRGMHFVFPFSGEVREVRSAESLRGQCVTLLKKGATFDQIQKLCASFDKKRGVTSESIERRAYELVRIMHHYLGYGLKHNEGSGVITLVTK